MCEIRGVPSPSLSWYKNGEPLATDDERYSLLLGEKAFTISRAEVRKYYVLNLEQLEQCVYCNGNYITTNQPKISVSLKPASFPVLPSQFQILDSIATYKDTNQ